MVDQRRDWRRWAVGAGLAAVLLGGLVALPIRHSISSATIEEKPVTPHSPAAAASPMEAVAPQPVPEASPPVAQASSVIPIVRAEGAASAGSSKSRSAPPRDEGLLSDARDAILRATPEALVKGKPIAWSAGPLHGYVVPGDRTDDGGRVCRNIYATTITGQEQQQGTAQRWCRPEDDTGWAPE